MLQVGQNAPNFSVRDHLGTLHSLQNLHGKRFNINTVRYILVGHDSSRIRVDQDGLNTFFTERLACLGTGVIKFSSLPNNNRAGTYHEHLFWFVGDDRLPFRSALRARPLRGSR